MKLTGFRIQNLKSIIDTGWKDLSLDNVTGLIGQNESGKTSILEGLMSFSNKTIKETSLRSDETLPIISCSFEFKEAEIEKILEGLNLPQKFLKFLKENGNRVNLTREWEDETNSSIKIEEQNTLDFFESANNEIVYRNNELTSKLEVFSIENSEVATDVKSLQQEIKEKKTFLTKIKRKSSDNEKKLTTNYNQEIKKALKTEIKSIAIEIEESTPEIEKKEIELNSKNKILKKINLFNKISAHVQLIKMKTKEIEQKREDLVINEKDYNNETEAASKTQKKRILTNVKKEITKLGKELKELKQNQYENFEIANLIVNHKKQFDIAVSNFNENNRQIINDLTPDLFARRVFANIPVFELFKDYSSILPNEIDIENIENRNSEIEGYDAVINLMKVAGIDNSLFLNKNVATRKKRIKDKNKSITLNFKKFWRQKIGKTNKISIEVELNYHPAEKGAKAGKPYVSFWVSDGDNLLRPNQRSLGVMWFLSFYLQVLASADENKDRGRIILIDEPGNSLHARAQEDVLEVFEHLKNKIQIVYSTHSPYLIDSTKAYRLLAVQRSEQEDDNSPTEVISAHKLGSANRDTLSPLYTVMGVDFSNQNAIQKSNNIILEEISAFYYFKAFIKLKSYKKNVNFLPSTGTSNIPTYVNLFIGWGLKFAVIIDDDGAGRGVYNTLKKDIFHNNQDEANKLLFKVKDCDGIEDVFTKNDFKKYILNDSKVELDNKNSDYVKGLAKGVLALDFMLKIQDGKIKFEDLEKTTANKITTIIDKIDFLLENMES